MVSILVHVVAVEVGGEARVVQVVRERRAPSLLKSVLHEECDAVEHLLHILLPGNVVRLMTAEDVLLQSALPGNAQGKGVGIVPLRALPEALHHVAEGSDAGERGGADARARRLLQHVPHRAVLRPGLKEELLHRGVADATRRFVDDAPQRLLVVGVRRQAQIAEQVLDFLPLIERHACIDVVGNVAVEETVLYLSALSVSAIEHGNAFVGDASPVRSLHFAQDDAGLVRVAVGREERDGTAHLLLAEHLLRYLFAIVADETAGSVHDGLRRPVVALQLEQAHTLVSLLEMEDIVDVRPTETIDALRIVAHHADALPLVRQQTDYLVLGEVRVLILVHQHILEPLLPLFGHLGIALEDEPSAEQQVVEVHGVGLLQAFLVTSVDFGRQRAVRVGIALPVVPDGKVVLREHEPVLGRRDTALYGSGLVDFLVERHLADDKAQQA